MAAFERATVGLFLWLSASAALGNDAYEQIVESRLAVTEAVERIAAEVRARGMRVVTRVDHSARARDGGFALPPTHSLEIGLQAGARPVRLVVWQARHGTTIVSVDGASLRDGRPFFRLTEVVDACLAGATRRAAPEV